MNSNWTFASGFRQLIRLVACLPLLALAAGPAVPTPRQRLEALATSLHYFETTNIISNRDPRSVGLMMQGYSGVGLYDQDWPQALADEHARMLAVLRDLDHERAALTELLRHPDPKVRTLALAGLFLREDAHDLPAIAALMRDNATTWPVWDWREGKGFERDGPGVTPVPQVVSDVARGMVWFYLKASHADPQDVRIPPASGGTDYRTGQGARTYLGLNPEKLQPAFDTYWARRGQRAHTAGWFLAKMERATRNVSPLQPEYQNDIRRVRIEIDARPPQERAWTLLYVRSNSRITEPDEIVPAAEMVDALVRAVPADTLLNFLRQEPATDDPDVTDGSQKGSPGGMDKPMPRFILSHANELLRPTDADAVRKMGPSDEPEWRAAAAELRAIVSPGEAAAALKEGLREIPLTMSEGRRDQMVLAAELWKIAGESEKSFLTDWFYTAQPKLGTQYELMQEVKRLNRPDTPALISAIIADPRFAAADWLLLHELLEVVPVVGAGEVSDHMPRGPAQPDLPQVLGQWRNLLRAHFGQQLLPTATPSTSLLSPQ